MERNCFYSAGRGCPSGLESRLGFVHRRDIDNHSGAYSARQFHQMFVGNDDTARCTAKLGVGRMHENGRPAACFRQGIVPADGDDQIEKPLPDGKPVSHRFQKPAGYKMDCLHLPPSDSFRAWVKMGNQNCVAHRQNRRIVKSHNAKDSDHEGFSHHLHVSTVVPPTHCGLSRI